MNQLPDHFVSLPIIISDYDAIIETKKSVQVPTDKIERSQRKPSVVEDKDSEVSAGFTESVEEIWARISDATKKKIREAAMEVLRRTDQTTADEKMSFQYDDDARFLD